MVHVKPRVPVTAAKEWMAEEITFIDTGKDKNIRDVLVTVPPGNVRVLELVVGP